MSIRNIDSDLAASNLNDLFHLHRYDDCVLYINRLNHLTLKKVLLQLPIKLYLSRLPYTIEIFEALYAKIFIHEPDTFPTRLLQPERFIDKMVAYFSLLNDRQLQNEPINGDKMLDSFENVIRIISYVQPNLYSRLLFFKYACDRACLKFEKDVDTYKNFNLPPNRKLKISKTTSSFSINNFDYSNALLISKASNMNTCDKVRFEIVQTINNCHKALLKLNEYIADLKNDKNLKCFKTRKSTSTERNSRDKSTNSTIKTRSESVFSFKTSSQKDIDNFSIFTKSTICQDFIQNRLFLYKSMMNTIEPFLKTIKIEKMMENLLEKINLDKEILLVFSHLKREDTYLNSMEPLEPLFKRYSLGFERCIQIWRKKCSADQLLLFNNPCNYEIIKQQLENSLMGSNEIERNSSSKLTSSFKRKNFMLKQNYLNTLSVSSDMAAKYVNGMDTMTDILNSNISINCFNLNEDDNEPKKYSSEINFYTNPSGNSTLPSKFKNRKRTSILNNKIFQNIHLDDDLRAEMENEPKMESTPKKQLPKTKNTETQTQNNLDESDKDKKLNEYLAQISELKRELDQANENVNNLLKKEESLQSKLKEKENELLEKIKKPVMLDYSSSTSNLIQTVDKESNDMISELISDRPNSPRNDTNYYQHTLDLINIYNNLNIKYRMEAYESLDCVNDMKAMTEFKIKLLFSVVVNKIFMNNLCLTNFTTELLGYCVFY
ncbi:unnamed protein product [Brachionus calyciflorus]|uniref:Uncharacterized protein n=1 Tax=Brachionus calyciflorus TaxID=104777 RepID=A0A813Z117_9BILA|nr:unnamed protein product [Brachionus calyciflorus]